MSLLLWISLPPSQDGLPLFSYQAYRESCRTWYASDPFSHQVHHQMCRTWCDFGLFLTRYAGKCTLPGTILPCFLPGAPGRWSTPGTILTCFLPGTPGNMAYQVRFHGKTVTGGDGRGGTCQGFLPFSYQVCNGMSHTWYTSAPFSYQVHHKMSLTWCDFGLFLTRYAGRWSTPGTILPRFLPGAPGNMAYQV